MSSRLKASQSPVMVITVFLTLTVVFYFVGVWLIFRLSSATPLMLSVGLAAIVTCLVTLKDLRNLGWHWRSWKIHRLSYLVPLCYASLA